jgi:uncharacterized membrane protein YphA (DoxX/SURF4 family)
MQNLTTHGRILLGLCFICEAGWMLWSYDIRAAYWELAGAPALLTIIIAPLYALGGAALVAGYKPTLAALPLVGLLILSTVILYSSYTPSGIGEYPAELHGEVNFKATLVSLAIIGALLLVHGHGVLASNMGAAMLRGQQFLLAGRLLLGAYYMSNAAWQLYYYEIRVEHILQTGGNPSVLPVAIAINFFGGLLVSGGLLLRVAIPLLVLLTTASTIMIHGDLSATAPYPPNVQIHQWFLKSAIIAGLLMIFGHGPVSGRLWRPADLVPNEREH